METLIGAVDRVVFRSSNDSFVVARFRAEGVSGQRTYDDLATIVGDLGRINPGEHLRLGGGWERHPKHGRHFRVQWFEQRLPSNASGIEKFLASGFIKGVGPATAKLVVDCFGERTLEVLDAHPEQLRQVPRLSRRRADLIVRGWHSQRQTRELMLFLQSHDLPVYLAGRIREKYGDECLSVIQRDPYQLSQDLQGVGFKTADAMAIKLGLSPVSESRFVAAIKYVLEEAARDGHVFLPRGELLARTAKLVQLPQNLLESGLLEASRQGVVALDADSIYLPPLFHSEKHAATGLQRLQAAPSFVDNQQLNPEPAVSAALKVLGISLADRQIEAAVMALREKVSIVTGGPGTGKTTCLHVIITALDLANIPYTLCAPTGRAAKRMSGATGRAASTIHRLLGFQPQTNGFSFDSSHQLPVQFVIVDEVSMLDIVLFNQFLKALPNECHLLLVGDGDQLPAIGPGNVLRDLLDSETVPSVTLDQLFRQAGNSRITVAAHRIRRGELPEPGPGGSDLYLVRVDGPEKAQAMVKELVSRRIPVKFHLDPKLDIQVLSPTHRGPAGVAALNRELQDLLNGSSAQGPEVVFGSGRFRQGDKVMQIRNNYDKDVYNGDVGIVTELEGEQQRLTVRFAEVDEPRDVEYEFADLGELVLAYAVSVHKAQGSEFPCVVIPLLTSHYPLLQRNLVYTALTRARQLCILVHQPQALKIAVGSEQGSKRFTMLAERVKIPSMSKDLQAEPLEVL